MIQTAISGCSVATGTVSHAGEVEGEDPEKKGYTGPPVWGLDCEANKLNPVKVLLFISLKMGAG